MSLVLLLGVAVVSAVSCDGHGRRGGSHLHHRGLQADQRDVQADAVVVQRANRARVLEGC